MVDIANSSHFSVLSSQPDCGYYRFYLERRTGKLRTGFQYQPIGASFRLMWTCFVSRYSSIPHGPSSRPKPDCLYPPQGASTYVGCMWLTHTTPARKDFTVRNALKMSRAQTAAASP